MLKYAVKPRRINNRNAQALVEFVISLIIIPIFFIGVVHLAQIVVVKIRLLQAARHGVWLVSTGRVSETTARREIEEFLDNGIPKLNRSNIRSVNFRMRQGAYSIDTVEINYRFRTFQFTDNFFKPLSYQDVTLQESASVGHVSLVGTPYLSF
jgi:hypothetical protein